MQRSKGKARAMEGERGGEGANLESPAIKEICDKIMSMNRADYISIVEDYCTDNILLDTDDLRVRGKGRLIQILDFTTAICKDSGVVGEPVWDPKTIRYGYFRHLKLGTRIAQTTILHFQEDECMKHGWRITVIGDPKLNSALSRIPILGPIHLHLFRPLFTYLILLLALLMRSTAKTNRAQRKETLSGS